MRRTHPYALLAGIALCFAGRSAVAQPADAPAPPKTFDVKAIDDYVAAQITAKEMVGLSLAIMRDGKIILAKGYGKTAVTDGAAAGTDTMFAIGSVTKQFTCACIFLLAEEAKLSVYDKVAKYFPDLTQARDITLYDLMSHVSGYPDYYPLDFVDRRMAKATAPDKLIQEYAGGKLDFPPGTRWSYSNTGYIILGRVIEKVSGMSYPGFLNERILKPLGMTHSALEPKPGTNGVARGHIAFALGDPEPAAPEAAGWIGAAGGLYCTASDLAAWDLALIQGKVVKPESFQLMSSPRRLADGRTKGYGCGLVITQRDGETILRHGGAVCGFVAQNAFIPRTRSAVIVLTNSESAEAATLHNLILALMLKDGASAAKDIPKINGPSAKDAALELFHQMQSGEIKRENLGDEFSHFMNADRVQNAKERLKALGEPTKVEVDDTSERGGMEVAVVRFTCKGQTVKALLYRTPDGKIQQMLLYKG